MAAAKKKALTKKPLKKPAAMATEPSFTMLARDPEFYHFVMAWAEQRENAVACGDRPDADLEQVAEARKLAKAGQLWRKATNGLWRA